MRTHGCPSAELRPRFMLLMMTSKHMPEPPSSKTESPVLWFPPAVFLPGCISWILAVFNPKHWHCHHWREQRERHRFAGAPSAAVRAHPAPSCVRVPCSAWWTTTACSMDYLSKAELIAGFFIMDRGISVIYSTKSWELHRNERLGKGAGRQELEPPQVSHNKPSPLLIQLQGHERPRFSWAWMSSEEDLSVMSGCARSCKQRAYGYYRSLLSYIRCPNIKSFFSEWGHQCPKGWRKGKAHHKPIQTQPSVQQLWREF